MKKRKIIVNKYCEINQNNIAKSVKNRRMTYMCKIYGKEKESDLFNKLIAIGYVKNKANAGWYSHTIYESENGKIIYEGEL